MTELMPSAGGACADCCFSWSEPPAFQTSWEHVQRFEAFFRRTAFRFNWRVPEVRWIPPGLVQCCGPQVPRPRFLGKPDVCPVLRVPFHLACFYGGGGGKGPKFRFKTHAKTYQGSGREAPAQKAGQTAGGIAVLWGLRQCMNPCQLGTKGNANV